MVSTNLLSLPAELLDKVFSYLDRDDFETTYPSRPDIFNISFSCRRLRETSIPTLFKHVALKLRWYQGALIQPALFRLRKDRPDLVRHIRALYIDADLYRTSAPPHDPIPFDIPAGIPDWISPTVGTTYTEERNDQLHRQRVTVVAQRVFVELQQSDAAPDASAFISQRIETFRHHIFRDDALRLSDAGSSGSNTLYSFQNASGESSQGDWAFESEQNNEVLTSSAKEKLAEKRAQLNAMTLRLDALVVAILCLPPNVTSLSFKPHPGTAGHQLRGAFALHVVAAAIEMLGDQLQRLAISSSPSIDREGSAALANLCKESAVLTPDVLGGLLNLKTLVLSGYQGSLSRGLRSAPSPETQKWTQLAGTVTHLKLCHCWWTPTELLNLIRDFDRLESLAMEEFTFWEQRVRGAPRPPTSDQMLWLKALIELRRQQPQLAVQLGNIMIPPSGKHWLLNEAVPTGCTVDYDREERLIEDFESFWSLWRAEDGERGNQAREARKDGSLVDEAMTNRWQTFAHLRK